MFKYESKVTLARPNSNSKRITLPKEVAKFMKVEIGDTVEFIVDFVDENNIKINLSKKEKK